MYFSAFGITDKGILHNKNQDCFAFGNKISSINSASEVFSDSGEIYKFCLCDGMSSCANSDIASNTACKVSVFSDLSNDDITKQLKIAIEQAEKQVSNIKNSASTIALLFSDGLYAQTANVGDSRTYLFRNSILKQLSYDHTQKKLFESLKIGGEFEDIFDVHSSALTQYLGISNEDIKIEPYFSEKILLEVNDLFLICSDGLTGFVPDNKITDVLKLDTDIQNKAKMLLQLAFDMGSDDNITIILCETYE